MDSFIAELIKTGGPLGVLVVVVWMFIKAGRDQATEHRVWMTQTMDNLQKQHLDARDITHDCINRNTAALDRTASAMTEIAKSVAKCDVQSSRRP